MHVDIVQGSDEEEDAGEVRQLYGEVDSGVVSGSEAEVVQGLDAEEDEEEIRQLNEEVDSDVVPGSDAEGQDRGEPGNKIGKRLTTRIMNDAYGKGIVRGQVENTNLRAFLRDNDVTAVLV